MSKLLLYISVTVLLVTTLIVNSSAQIIDVQLEYNSKNEYASISAIIVDWEDYYDMKVIPTEVDENYSIKMGISSQLYKFLYFRTEVGSSTNDFRFYMWYDRSPEDKGYSFYGDYKIDHKYIALLPELRFSYSVFGINMGLGPNFHINDILMEELMLENDILDESYTIQHTPFTVGLNWYINFTLHFKRVGITFGVCQKKIPVIEKTSLYPGISLKLSKLNLGMIYLFGEAKSGYEINF